MAKLKLESYKSLETVIDEAKALGFTRCYLRHDEPAVPLEELLKVQRGVDFYRIKKDRRYTPWGDAPKVWIISRHAEILRLGGTEIV